MKLKFSFKLLSILLICFLFTITISCSVYVPPESEVPMAQWTDEQLLTQAKQEYADKDYKQSYRHLYPLVKKNNPEALYALGYQYYHGLGIETNYDIAQDLIRKSAELGYQPAVQALRLFVASKSTFTVDTKKPSYLALNEPKDTTQITKKQETADQSIDEMMEDIANVKDSKNQDKGFGPNSAPEPVISKNTNDLNQGVKQDLLEDLVQDLIKESTKSSDTTDLNLNLELAAGSKPHNPSSTKINNLKPKKQRLIIPRTDLPPKTPSGKKYKIKQLSLNSQEQEQEQEKTEQNKPTENNNQETAQNININLNDNSKWLETQNPDNYTIQITATQNQEELNKFIIAHNLQNKVKSFAYTYNSKTWYGLSYGNYNKPSEAYQALLDDIPSDIKLKKPWVRQFKNILPVTNQKATDVG